MSNLEEMSGLSANEVLDITQEFRDHFGLSVNPRINPAEFNQAVQEVNPRFTGERKHINVVRFQLEEDVTDYTNEDKAVIMRVSEGLQMLKQETPLVGEFDVIAGLGAARMANYDRLAYAVESIKTGRSIGRLIVAGSIRDLVPGEAEAASSYAPEYAATEADLVRGAADKISEEHDIEIPVVIVENKRAHNALIVDAIMSAFPNIRRIAGVTTQIYQTRTALDFARRALAYGASAYVAGNPSDPNIVEKRTPATYQSEVAGAQQAAAKYFV